VLRIICTDKVVCQNMCIMEGNVLVLSYGLVGLKATSMHEARIWGFDRLPLSQTRVTCDDTNFWKIGRSKCTKVNP
jgi:hypothetical protein